MATSSLAAAQSKMRVIHLSKAEDIPRAPIDGKPTIVYWNIIGLVQGIRIALSLAEIDFVDVRLDPGDPNGDKYKGEWFSIKSSLEEIIPFPNLPYFMDKDVCLSQSNAILRYLGRKYDLMGDSGTEHLVDMCLDQVIDEETQMTNQAYPLGADALREWYIKSGPSILARWTKLVQQSNGEFVTGKCISIADCKLFVLLYKFGVIEEQLGTPDTSRYMSDELKAYMKRIETYPALQEYFNSPNYQKHPLNNPKAKWIG